MLNQIHIRDLATIEELQLPLNAGSTMITGETGAGKSIFIEAIELALGGRASGNMIRVGKEKADISLCFDIQHFPRVVDCLKQLDLYHDTAECIIRRVITADGRSRCYVNGAPATLALVKELGELLFHLHSQHEQQVLLKADTQRDMLDRFADHLPLALQVKQLAEECKSLQQQIQQLRDKTLERSDRIDYLNFQLTELQQVNLQDGEWTTLETEHHRLTHSEELRQHIQQALQILSDNDAHDVTTAIHEARRALESMQSLEPKSKEWLSMLQSALIQVEELSADLNKYIEHAELDPEKMRQIEERVSLIFNLARKHKVNPDELVAYQQRLQAELDGLQSSDDNIAKLELQLKNAIASYQTLADQLSAGRQKASAGLEKEITATIRSLSLPHGEFKISLEKDNTSLAPYGQEKVVFLIKTNPDQPLQPLGKVISGGELSRLSLAAHLALANHTNIPTLIFDEVDTGLSGATAEKIGKLLRKLGDSYQVFCVTHQPQVAACGHNQLLVEKYFVEKSTHTRLRALDTKERTAEIARMLGGEKITKTTLVHAKEVLEGAH